MWSLLVVAAFAQSDAPPSSGGVEEDPAPWRPYLPETLPKPGSEPWEYVRQDVQAYRRQSPARAAEVWVAEFLLRYDAVHPRPPKRVGGAPASQDTDGDAVVDWRDLCPTLPEDRPDVRADGCPDDGRDDVPVFSYQQGGRLAPEPPDRPSGDRDRDGITDSADGCPEDAEDLDGWEDPDGCPDLDDDADGVADAVDGCPLDPETFDGVDDADGCPDALVSAPPPAPAWPPAPAPAPPMPIALPTGLPTLESPLRTGIRKPGDAAVVVGLEDYAFVPDVPYARRDAQAFADWLVYTRGVPLDRVRILTSGSRDHLVKAVEAAGREVGPGGVVWVYYAGHGAADPTTRERMVLGDDFRADETGFGRGVPVGELERLAGVGGGRPVLVLDTCYAGVGRSGGDLVAGMRFAVPAYAAASAPGVVEWNAAGPNELSGPLDPVRHGAFTYWVVGALRGWADGELDGRPDGQVTGDEAQAYVTRKLRGAQIRDQRPVWMGPKETVLAEGASERGPEP